MLSLDIFNVTCLLFHLPQDPLEFQAKELRKHFNVGDHVKVIAGRHEGETGLIVRIEVNLAVLFSDLTMHEVSGRDHECVFHSYMHCNSHSRMMLHVYSRLVNTQQSKYETYIHKDVYSY